jgi:hypothetical protein
MAVRLSALRIGRLLPPREDSWYSFLLEAESTPEPYAIGPSDFLKAYSKFSAVPPKNYRDRTMIMPRPLLVKIHHNLSFVLPSGAIESSY